MAVSIIPSATATPDRSPGITDKYVPNRLLGRSGYVASSEDRLPRVLAQLDALMQVLYDPDITETSIEDFTHTDVGSFQRMNQHIQCEVLGLAADLARDAHELFTELHVFGDGAQGGAR